ncbi:hypothetical protein ONS96_014797 [Cadophora gregata f. sp. sojae]|nr:hypothetical protein ONS96_014797 [Cadophora gregata f. sp. sojae]
MSSLHHISAKRRSDSVESNTRETCVRNNRSNKTFDDIEQNMQEKRLISRPQQSLVTPTVKRRFRNCGNAGEARKRGKSSTEEKKLTVKTKHEFPAARYHDELTTIQEKLDLVASSKLIESYSVPDRHRALHSKLKNLKSKTKGLMAQLDNRGKFFALANRLISGDGLDSDLGRLDGEVMWFIAELKYRQMDGESSATLVG